MGSWKGKRVGTGKAREEWRRRGIPVALRPRDARHASPSKDAAGSAHRKGGQEDLDARSGTSVSQAAGSLASLQPGTCLGEERARAGSGWRGHREEGPTAHSHWRPLGADPALRTCHRPFGGATSGKERKRRVGGGVVKMAAPLRIQSDWAQALR